MSSKQFMNTDKYLSQNDVLLLVTSYFPNDSKWEDDFKTRKVVV